jgi:hypothetical protein
MDLFGDVDPNPDAHGAPSPPSLLRRPFLAGLALHSDRTRSLISGREGVAERADLLSEPSWRLAQ